MTARRIDGRAHAAAMREDTRRAAEAFRSHVGRAPGLAVVLVGDDPASQVYVRNKDKAASEAGFEVRTLRLDAGTSQALLMGVVRELNRDEAVDGILVQLPLPAHLDPAQVLRALDPGKDVDGLHPDNIAALWGGGRGLVPCTPAGCLALLEREGVPIEGQRAVVLGRSLLVGKPVAALLLERNATVSIAHSRSRDLPELCRQADILVAAVGRPEMVRGDWVRPGAAVIDVGINRREDGSLVGDVAFSEVEREAGWITPVPGGVGPMTIAMLLRNTYQAGARAAELDPTELTAPGARR
jgi:methylenetetrahydrofolate dehydrogenase (NADP+) / methenyltetrahydrofolate cyclohydrolase